VTVTHTKAPGDTVANSAAPIDAEKRVKRHRISTRLWHWTNAVVFVVMLMSGLMIFNAHPRLYWGSFGANPDYAWLQIGARRNAGGDQEGYLRVGSIEIETTGILGRWTDDENVAHNRAIPSWATIPSSYNLAESRRWHLTVAWIFALGIFAYLVLSALNRHLSQDLAPERGELSPGHVWQDVKDHARLRFPQGEAARHYGILQKATYLAVLIGLIPAMVLTGLTMSPQIDATWPWLLDLFGGRQSARSIHFIAAILLVLFVIVHLVMVVLAGPINEIRSMITGWYRLPRERR